MRLPWSWLGHQQLGREFLPRSGQLWPDRLVRLSRYCPEPVEALAKVADKAMGLTEALRSARGLAAAKYFESSFEMLVIALDSLLYCFAGEVLDLRQHGSQSGRVGSGFICGHRVRRHPGTLESGAEESRGGFGGVC
jgi:hypothetical protein